MFVIDLTMLCHIYSYLIHVVYKYPKYRVSTQNPKIIIIWLCRCVCVTVDLVSSVCRHQSSSESTSTCLILLQLVVILDYLRNNLTSNPDPSSRINFHFASGFQFLL
jgi:hypothetical protein